MSIQIKTSLHESIYRSHGGGETRIHYDFATGPRNLLKAIRILHEHSKAMTEGFGNIGHQGSRIEIDGTAIRWYDMQDVIESGCEGYSDSGGASRTEKAKELIAAVRDGSLVDGYKALDAATDPCAA